MTASKFSSVFLTSALLLTGGVFLFLNSDQVVLIESMESKTHEGKPVFNKISFQSLPDKDVWSMDQSHYGLDASQDKWDQIQITVDRRKRPYLVRYQQFAGGKEVELKATCFTCHPNGPRAIRPDFGSKAVTYSWKDELAIAAMNLKIKTYGRTEIAPESYKLKGEFRKLPLKYFGKGDQEKLGVQTCLKCHHADSLFGRGYLQRQHAGTIKHLVDTGEMPPFPFKLSTEEKRQLQRFVKGF